MKQLEEMSLAELQAVAAQHGVQQQDDGLEGKSIEELQAMASSLPGGKPELIQEMHPSFSRLDRMRLKNFAQSPEATKAFIQKEYPGLELTEIEGQLAMRKPGEQQYRALDPEGWANLNPKEIFQDAGDLLYDAGSGVAQGVATAAGGLSGGPLGAIGAGAASGAGLEALRQYGGKMMGIPQEVDGLDVALSGGIGAIDPLLFGTGKGLKGSLVREGGLKKGVSELGEMLTGVNAGTWMRAADDPLKMKTIQATGEKKFVEEAIGTLRKNVTKAVDETGAAISEKARNSGAMINIGRSKAVVKQRIGEIRALPNRNARDEAYLNQLENLYEKTFMTDAAVPDASGMLGPNTPSIRQEMPDTVDAETAYRVRDTIDEVVDYKKDKYALDTQDKRVQGMAKAASGDIRKQMREIPGVDKLYGDYKQAKTDLQYLQGYMQNKKNMVPDNSEDGLNLMFDKKGGRFLKGAGANPEEKEGLDILRRLDKRYGTGLAEDAQDLAASSVWTKAGWSPQSLKGTTSTTRSQQAKAIGHAGGALLGYNLSERDKNTAGVLGGAAGGFLLSPKAFKQYMRMSGVPSVLRPELRQSIWNSMEEQQ